MIKMKQEFDQDILKKLFNKKSKAINVSFFHKFNSKNDLKGKKFTVVDFEFSTDYQIFEMAFFDIIDGVVSNHYFKEIQLPIGSTYYNIEQKCIINVDKSFNKGKDKLTSEIKKYIIDRMENCDYLVAHNYVAELQCYMKIKYPNRKYNSLEIPMFIENKVICTSYSFNKKYFNLISAGNGEVSNHFGWIVSINEESDKLIFKLTHKVSKFSSSYHVDKIVFSKKNASYHNAMFDIFVTLTNLKTLGYFLK